MARDPNFPPNLDIKPLEQAENWGDAFSSESQLAAIEKYGIAGRVWEAAYTLLIYVIPPTDWQFDPPFRTADHDLPTVIELGSGTGIVASRVASALRASSGTVVVTDLPEVCPLLEVNLRNDALFVRPLSWGNAEHFAAIRSEFLSERKLTDVICSDLVYFPELLAPLLRSLIHLTSFDLPRIIISYKIRSLPKETPFWAAFGLYFSYQPVLVRQDDHWEHFSGSSVDTMFVFVAHRRPESLTWPIPTLDDDLLAGVGARGTDTPKVDDYFESLLFMAMNT